MEPRHKLASWLKDSAQVLYALTQLQHVCFHYPGAEGYSCFVYGSCITKLYTLDDAQVLYQESPGAFL